jgi:sec-independent protein translocase protein TatB
VFGISFGELMLVATVALLVVGPQKLPQMLRTLGTWIARLRRVMTDVRSQSGIDDILRSEGLEGGLNELRTIVRGAGGGLAARAFQGATSTPVARRAETFVEDRSREYPVEGADALGALPEDLLPKGPKLLAPAAPAAAELLVVPPGNIPPGGTPSLPPRPAATRLEKPRSVAPAPELEKPVSGPQAPREATSGERQTP